MFTFFVLGNIASGKSTASHYLAGTRGLYIDLDELCKNMYVLGSSVVDDLAEHFGFQIIDSNGGINRQKLARIAFASPESAQSLNAIVHPYLKEQLALRLVGSNCCTAEQPSYEYAVVEISVASSLPEFADLADCVVAITCPLATRRVRAIERGMLASDFDARALCQVDEDDLCSMADIVISNDGDAETLYNQLDLLLASKGFSRA